MCACLAACSHTHNRRPHFRISRACVRPCVHPFNQPTNQPTNQHALPVFVHLHCVVTTQAQAVFFRLSLHIHSSTANSPGVLSYDLVCCPYRYEQSRGRLSSRGRRHPSDAFETKVFKDDDDDGDDGDNIITNRSRRPSSSFLASLGPKELPALALQQYNCDGGGGGNGGRGVVDCGGDGDNHYHHQHRPPNATSRNADDPLVTMKITAELWNDLTSSSDEEDSGGVVKWAKASAVDEKGVLSFCSQVVWCGVRVCVVFVFRRARFGIQRCCVGAGV